MRGLLRGDNNNETDAVRLGQAIRSQIQMTNIIVKYRDNVNLSVKVTFRFRPSGIHTSVTFDATTGTKNGLIIYHVEISKGISIKRKT